MLALIFEPMAGTGNLSLLHLAVGSGAFCSYRQFTIQCCPNASYGYLYIGAWQYWPDGCRYEQKEPDTKAKWSSTKFPVPAIGTKIKAAINGQWKGVVTGYFVEHGYQGIEVDCTGHKRPAYYEKQGGDPKQVFFFGVDLTAIESD